MAGLKPAAFAATWRDSENEIVSSTWGGTMCWMPRRPGRLRIAREGFAHIVRCGECPGCLELDRRRLASRLWERYQPLASVTGVRSPKLPDHRAQGSGAGGATLYLVRIYCPLDRQSAFAHSLHRRAGLQLEPGFWRLGLGSFAVLARDRTPLHILCERRGWKHRIEPLKLRRRRRAFRPLTAGLLVMRERYGAQVKRYYCRGLPKAERESWTVEKIAYEAGYRRQTSPRAWTGRRVVLVPPEAWLLGRADRTHLRRLLALPSTPELAEQVAALVQGFTQKRALDSNLAVSTRPQLSREAVQEFYRAMAARKGRPAAGRTADSSSSPPSKGGGYVSSEHSQGELMPRELQRAADRELFARVREKAGDSLSSIFDRLIKRAEEREGKALPEARAAADKLRKSRERGE